MNFFSRGFDYLDGILDRFTTYRLVLYCLYGYVGWAIVASLIGSLSYKWYDIALSAIWIGFVSAAANRLFSLIFKVGSNKDSYLITALILTLILTPAVSFKDYLLVGSAAAATAIASKFLLTIGDRHIFNPAAFGAFISGLIFGSYASWWVGTKPLTPLVVIGGVLILRKMKRFSMALIFMAVYLIYLAIHSSMHGGFSVHLLWIALISTQLIFFTTVMLTEPLTSPSVFRQTLLYALVIGVLYSGLSLKLSPEEALLVGNALAYIMNPYKRFRLVYQKTIKEAEGIYSFIFKPKARLAYRPGQYMEWTLSESDSDSRGSRRYLSLSSSPTEENLAFTVKVPIKASSFKNKLLSLVQSNEIFVSQLAGTFSLPKDATQKVALLAGGVGITPFRSMIKNAVDANQGLDAYLIYAVNRPSELAFMSLFEQAEKLGIKPIYVASAPAAGWQGATGFIDMKLIKNSISDWTERIFFISGPHGFVVSTHNELLKLGVPTAKIITDYFPGYGG